MANPFRFSLQRYGQIPFYLGQLGAPSSASRDTNELFGGKFEIRREKAANTEGMRSIVLESGLEASETPSNGPKVSSIL